MSSRETGNGINWRFVLAIGTPIAISIAAVSIYIYYSRKKRKEVSQDIDTSEDRRGVKHPSGPATQHPPEGINEEEAAALRWLMEKKAEANSCFSKKEFQRAVELYTKLIEECPPMDSLKSDLAKIYHNRAATYEKLQGEECNLRIIEDCTRAIDIDPKYAKARVRRAKAHEATGEILLCLKDWTLAGVLQPQLIESDPAYLRLDQLVSKKGLEIAEEVMETHTVLLPSKVNVEDLMNLFFDFEFYTDANLLDLYREIAEVEAAPAKPAVPQLSTYTPDENGINATGDSATGDSATGDNSTGDSAMENDATGDDTVNSSDASVPILMESDTAGATNHTSADNRADDQELMRRLETEPFWRAIHFLRSRQYSRIVEITSQAIDTGCKVFHPYALLVRSTFHIILCQYAEALRDSKLILSCQNISSQVRVGALMRIACVNEALGDFDAAINTFKEAQQIDPTNPSTFLVRSKFYTSDDRPDLDKAQADINKCIELRPHNNLTGRCFYALLKFKLASSTQSVVEMEKVKRHVRETMNQFPDRPEPIAIYAQVLMEIQELHEASQYLEKAIEMDPDNGMLYVYRSQCKLYLRGVNTQGLGAVNSPHMVEATNDALEQLEYAIRIDPQCAIAMETIATICSQTGDSARALQYLDKAIEYVRTKQEMASLQTLKLILSFQPEIHKEMMACGLDPLTLQEYQFRQ